jgi:hypothetical protein
MINDFVKRDHLQLVKRRREIKRVTYILMQNVHFFYFELKAFKNPNISLK